MEDKRNVWSKPTCPGYGPFCGLCEPRLPCYARDEVIDRIGDLVVTSTLQEDCADWHCLRRYEPQCLNQGMCPCWRKDKPSEWWARFAAYNVECEKKRGILQRYGVIHGETA